MATPETCPHCGADVPPDAKACPECGSCEETGWSPGAAYSALDLPDENFDYEGFVTKEFGAGKVRPRGISWFWWIAGLVALAVILAFLVR